MCLGLYSYQYIAINVVWWKPNTHFLFNHKKWYVYYIYIYIYIIRLRSPNFYEVIVNGGEARVNYRFIKIESE